MLIAVGGGGGIVGTSDSGEKMNAVTLFGVSALGFMMVMYAFERRHPGFVAAFAAGCLLSSVYGFISGAWPFGTVEAIWAVVAGRRYVLSRTLHLPERPE